LGVLNYAHLYFIEIWLEAFIHIEGKHIIIKEIICFGCAFITTLAVESMGTRNKIAYWIAA
jgi:hypothetical protein